MTDITISVANHNIGGGSTEGSGLYSSGLAPIGSVRRFTQTNGCEIVTLQECLRSEFDKFVASGWCGAFIPMTTADENKFRGNEDKGQAILSLHPMTDVTIVPLPVIPLVQTRKDFSLLLAKVNHPDFRSVKEELWIATTHLWSAGIDPATGVAYPGWVNDQTRAHQAVTISNYLNQRVSGKKRWVLTGDFNTGPKTAPIDYLHRLNRDGSVGTAKFWEGDQAFTGELKRDGRDTVTGRKIDYFFTSHRGVDPLNGVSLKLVGASPNGGDCHDKVMRGTVTYGGLTPA